MYLDNIARIHNYVPQFLIPSNGRIFVEAEAVFRCAAHAIYSSGRVGCTSTRGLSQRVIPTFPQATTDNKSKTLFACVIEAQTSLLMKWGGATGCENLFYFWA